jgi:hypothetical protein
VIARAAAESGGDLDAFVAREHARIRAAVEPLLDVPGGSCPVAVSVVIGPDDPVAVSYAAAQPEPGYTGRNAAQVAVADAAARERTAPLGPSAVAETPVPIGWWMAVAVGVGAAAWYAWRRPWARAAMAADDGGSPDVANAFAAVDDAPPASALDASEMVRGNPATAAGIVVGWLDGGYDERVAHFVVALDADAAGAVLGAMPVDAVRRATAALGAVDAPSNDELASAAECFLEEFDMVRDGVAYRDDPEAA